jgi:hypothetical protein
MMQVMPDKPEQPADKPPQPPEGALLHKAMIRKRLSARQAGPLAGISEGRWRQIVAGYMSARGQYIPVTAPAKTLAHMAAAMDLTPDDLIKADRPDAAEILEDLIRSGAAPTRGSAPQDEEEALVKVMRSNLTDEQKKALVQLLIAERAAAEQARAKRAEDLIRMFEQT